MQCETTMTARFKQPCSDLLEGGDDDAATAISNQNTPALHWQA